MNARDDLLTALGTSISEEDIDKMFSQLGCSKQRLFFADLLRLLTDSSAGGRATTAGVVADKMPAFLGDKAGKSLSMSDLVTTTEAKLKQESTESLTTAQQLLSRARTVTNLSKVVRSMSGNLDSKRNPAGDTSPAHPTSASPTTFAKRMISKRKSAMGKDGGAVVATGATHGSTPGRV